MVSAAWAQTAGQTPKTGSNHKVIERIAGTWKLQQIVDDNKKATGSQQHPDTRSNAFQMLEFAPDGRYKSSNGTQAVDSGSYRINEEHALLYLESDAHQDPSEWLITFGRDKRLTLQARGDARHKGFRYVYQQTREGVSTNRD